MASFGLIINGRVVQTEQYQDVVNPSTEEPVGQMPLATLDDLDGAVEAAEAAFRTWKLKPVEERAAACLAIADKMEANAEELAHLITAEQGKPLNGMGSRFEVGGAAAWTRATAVLELPVEVLRDEDGGHVELHRRPIGVIGSITPWNWPLIIASWHIIPAIRAGNTVVIKPSPLTPLSTIRLVELMNEILPPGVVNVVTGTTEIGSSMSSHPGIAKIVFTGSTGTGKKIMSAAANTLKRLTLELGGNDAAIVLPDVDPAAIAEKIFWGAFVNNGQTCAALKRLYVHDEIYDEVCRSLSAYAQKVVTGDGLSEDSVLGPIQNKAQFNIVSTFVDEAVQKGGRILTGGQAPSGKGNFYPVTLVADVDHGCRLVDEEQFGPALPIIRFTTTDEVISKANSSAFGLGGSVWSKDVGKAKEIAAQLDCGTVWINDHSAIQPIAPFGGVKQSGIGVAFGVEGLKEFTTIQTIIS